MLVEYSDARSPAALTCQCQYINHRGHRGIQCSHWQRCLPLVCIENTHITRAGVARRRRSFIFGMNLIDPGTSAAPPRLTGNAACFLSEYEPGDGDWQSIAFLLNSSASPSRHGGIEKSIRAGTMPNECMRSIVWRKRAAATTNASPFLFIHRATEDTEEFNAHMGNIACLRSALHIHTLHVLAAQGDAGPASLE